MSRTLLIACGALAHELVAVLKANQWSHIEVQCLPAHWHNTPDKIAPGVEQLIVEHRDNVDSILIGYGDCGTGGHLDTVIDRHNSPQLKIDRLPGAHCYAFFAGLERFETLAEDELGTFFLTDYLAWHFDRLILEELGINKHPELRDMYFGNYTRMLYLAQTENPERLAQAQQAAAAINLPLEVHYTGLEPFSEAMNAINIVPIQASAK